MISRTHIWRNRLIILLASLLILIALIFSVMRMLLPYVTDYGETIRLQLAKQLGIPVSIKTVNAEIWWLSPRLKLTDVGIFDPDGTRQILQANEILVGFDWLASIRQRHLQLGFISFNGMRLQVRHLAKGGWQIQGLTLPVPGDGPLQLPQELLDLLQDTSIYLHDIQLDWYDEQRNDQHLLISDLNISLLNNAPYHELGIDLELPPAYGGHVRILVALEGPIEQPAQWQGRIYTAVEHLQLKPWFNDYWQLFDFTADGQLDASVWIDWQQLQIQQVHSYINGERLALHYLHKDVNSWKLNQLIGNFRWQYGLHGWQADASGLEVHRDNEHWRQPSALSLVMDNQQQQIKLRASYLQVDDLAYLAGLGNSFLRQPGPDWNTPLQAWQPHGELFDVDTQWSLDSTELVSFSSRFVDASFVSQQAGLPSVSGLDGQLNYQHRQARVLLDSKNATLTFKDLFRQPLQLQSIKTDVFVNHTVQRTELYAADIKAVTPHIVTHSRLHMVADRDLPVFMDLVTNYDHGQGAYVSHYLPTGIMHKATVEWLDQALVAANIPRGGFLFYGQLQDFPFASNQGVMLAQFDVIQGQLKYQADWPQIDNLAARVRFKNNAMLIDQGRGTIFGAKLANTTVSIDKLNEAVLVIKGDVAGPLTDLVQFVGASPLNEPLAFVGSMQTTGNANLGLDLQIPLAGESHQVLVSGNLALTGNELFLPATGYRFKGVNGVLHFTEASLEAERIRASLDSYPLSLRIDPVQIDGISHSRIAVQGFAPLASLLAPIPDWKDKVAGGSDWQVTLDIPMQTRPDGVEVALTASGEMLGVSSQMPLFLAKPAQQPGSMRFGLDVLADGDLNIRAALSGNYEAHAERRQQRWRVDVDCAMLRGTASFMEDFAADELLRVDLERLDLAALQASQSVTANSIAGAPADGVLPTQIPPLKVHIAQLNWNKVQLQNVVLQTHRSNAGMEIDKLKLNGPEFSLEGRGSWLSAWRVPHASRIDFKVKAKNLGATLVQMGMAQSLENTRGEAEIHWRWPDAPQNFNWSILTGDADLHLQDGRLQHVEAGAAGRMLGIFNFRTLLSLDFGDQMRDGFAFDEVTAHYTFANGNAYSNDFKIQSKVAEIHMQGRIGLVKEDYDQAITVIPGVSNTLTLIGAVAGGPVTGILVHVFQKILRVDKLARYKYTVKGSWDKPNVTLLDAPQAANNENTEP